MVSIKLKESKLNNRARQLLYLALALLLLAHTPSANGKNTVAVLEANDYRLDKVNGAKIGT